MQETLSAPEAMRLYRERAGLSQYEVQCELGLSSSSLSLIENGRMVPTLEMAERIEEVFKIPVSEWSHLRTNPLIETRKQRTEEVLRLRSSGLSLSDIARQLGVTRQRIDQLINPAKNRARQAVTNAIEQGNIERPASCEQCGKASKSLEAHHDDYTKPLDVRFLCSKCHRRADWNIRNGKKAA